MPNESLLVEDIVYRILAERRIPASTYRLQFNADFTYTDALALIDYLHALGISDAYASPLFKPRAGSTHGYDTVDYNQLNPALGSEADFGAWSLALRKRGLGLLLDVVPNHMGVAPENRWWMDVLENGMASTYASYFDIDWELSERSRHKVLLPVLGDHFGRVLEQGDIRLQYRDGAFVLCYGDFCLPTFVGSWDTILDACVEQLSADAALEPVIAELMSIADSARALPNHDEAAPQRAQALRREASVIKRRVAALYETQPAVRAALEGALARLNGTPGKPSSFDVLEAFAQRQPYRMAYWRVAADEINSRRFFDINDMAAVRNELPNVFNDAHRKLFALLQAGLVTGVRLDHPDGLWNPPVYYLSLQEGYVRARAAYYTESETARSAVSGTFATRFGRSAEMKGEWPLYVVVEKILSEIEPLPDDWAVYGTTGYDFLIAVNNVFVNRDHVHAFDALYSRFIGQKLDFRELVYEKKKQIMTSSLASEINSRGHQLARITERSRRFQGFARNSLTSALIELIACMSIYRTYITAPGVVSDRDHHYLEEAVEEAKRRNPRTPREIFDFLRDVLLLQNIYEFAESERGALIEFVMRFQQTTGPVMAKSVEDTTFYIYNRLASLNEVGGNPEQFGIGVDDLHRHNLWRARYWPHTLLTLSTHDTKRSEDVRARLNVLSEIPGEWEAAIWRWQAMNAGAKTSLEGTLAPDSNDEYLLYQTLVGAHPLVLDTPEAVAEYQGRITTYMQKAINEAKVHTSWINANEAYNRAMQKFVERLFANHAFLDDLGAFARRIAFFGRFNSLSQTLLKLLSPGIPDTYQGCELFDFSLVDPDNRRKVDYVARRAALNWLTSRTETGDLVSLARELVQNAENGYIKLYVTTCALNFRQERADFFANADYLPLAAAGECARHVCAFARVRDGEWAVCAVPVLNVALVDGAEHAPLGDIWRDTRLMLPANAPTGWRNVFTGEVFTAQTENGIKSISFAALCGQFPVALLEATD
jgi:(1->4)-alpha-D-glucan 1-alpha-D-glucosylmutase